MKKSTGDMSRRQLAPSPAAVPAPSYSKSLELQRKASGVRASRPPTETAIAVAAPAAVCRGASIPSQILSTVVAHSIFLFCSFYRLLYLQLLLLALLLLSPAFDSLFLLFLPCIFFFIVAMPPRKRARTDDEAELREEQKGTAAVAIGGPKPSKRHVALSEELELEVETRCNNILSVAAALKTALRSQLQIELLRLPAKIRTMRMGDFLLSQHSAMSASGASSATVSQILMSARKAAGHVPGMMLASGAASSLVPNTPGASLLMMNPGTSRRMTRSAAALGSSLVFPAHGGGSLIMQTPSARVAVSRATAPGTASQPPYPARQAPAVSIHLSSSSSSASSSSLGSHDITQGATQESLSEPQRHEAIVKLAALQEEMHKLMSQLIQPSAATPSVSSRKSSRRH